MRKLTLCAAVVGLVTGCGDSAEETSAEFDSLCQDLISSTCSDGDSAPDVTNSYEGTGRTVSTSNELWEVGNYEDFTAQLDTSVAGKVSGVFDMGSFALEVSDARYSGEGDEFTIYGTDIVEDGECDLEARVVITGTRSSSGELSGELALEFTDNISGSDCDAEVIHGYPGTGAVFAYTAKPWSDAS